MWPSNYICIVCQSLIKLLWFLCSAVHLWTVLCLHGTLFPFNLLTSKYVQKHLLPLPAFPSIKCQQHKFCLCILFSHFFSKKQIHNNVNHTHQESGTLAFAASFLSKGNPLLLPAALFLFILLFLWVFHWAGVPPRPWCWWYSSAPSMNRLLTNCLYGPAANRSFFPLVFRSRKYVSVWQRGKRFCLCRLLGFSPLNRMVMYSFFVSLLDYL